MEKHAMALGYFFLAAFCLFASGQPTVPFRLPLLRAGLAAALLGLVFFASACTPLITKIKNWIRATKDSFVELVRPVDMARELPPYLSAFQEDQPSDVVAK